MPGSRTVRAFVLAGGRSSRMGRDKALLRVPATGLTLVETVARQAALATLGDATLLGDPALYSHLGYEVIEDRIPGQGPMSGLHAALTATAAEWNLLLACDLAGVTADFLAALLAEIPVDAQPPCVAAETARGLEPLCAVYHRNTLGAAEKAITAGRLRMRDFVAELGAKSVPAPAAGLLANVNTELDWQGYLTETARRNG